MTSAFSGTNPANDNPFTNNVRGKALLTNHKLLTFHQIHYTNWIFNAIDEGKIDSLFSIAIERGANGGGGQVALGGLPTISFDHNFASTPIEIYNLEPKHLAKANNYTVSICAELFANFC